MEKNAKLVEIFKNEQFMEASKTLKTAEELQELFSRFGLELSMDEVHELCAQIANSMKDGELEETDLEAVSGGIGWVAVAAIALGVVCIGAFAVGVYNGYKEAKNG